jgi:hypothetical protein
MPLGKRWIGCMLIGIGLMLFGVSRQHWQEGLGFAVLAAGIALVLPERITGRRALQRFNALSRHVFVNT